MTKSNVIQMKSNAPAHVALGRENAQRLAALGVDLSESAAIFARLSAVEALLVGPAQRDALELKFQENVSSMLDEIEKAMAEQETAAPVDGQLDGQLSIDDLTRVDL